MPRSWSSRVGIGLLVLASPLFLAVGWFLLVDWPWDVGIGIAAALSSHDVIQSADAEETGVSLMLLCIATWAVCWTLHVRLPERLVWPAALYGTLLCVPLIALLGIGVNYGLDGLLAARGYHYCAYHVISTDKGGNGTHVYVKDSLPGACAAVEGMFPPGTAVPGRREPFDLAVHRTDVGGSRVCRVDSVLGRCGQPQREPHGFARRFWSCARTKTARLQRVQV